MIHLLSTTVLEEGLRESLDSDFQDGFDPAVILDWGLTDADSVVEWAARTCYKSNPKFGSNPRFVAKLVEMGHLDVLEHASACFAIEIKQYDDMFEDLLLIKRLCPFLEYDLVNATGKWAYIIVYGNLRAWLEGLTSPTNEAAWEFLLSSGDLFNLRSYLYIIAPNVFYQWEPDVDLWQQKNNLRDIKLVGMNNVIPQTNPDVMLLAKTASRSDLSHSRQPNHVVYQLDNISRSFTHQHVRHRVLSHSQESQRYVDGRNEDYADIMFIPYVTPEGIKGGNSATLNEYMEQVGCYYDELRSYGVKKEDARAVLPNCTSTKIISSGHYAGWQHYFKLRMAKDAQAEIRQVATSMHELMKLCNFENGDNEWNMTKMKKYE